MCQSVLNSPGDAPHTPARLLVDSRCALGEGVQWHSARARVYWTDIFGSVLLSCDENGNDIRELNLDAGLCAFAFTSRGDILAAFADGLFWLDEATGQRSLIAPYQPDLTRTRMNDGNLDRQGRFIVGGIDEEGMTPLTPVWRVEQTRVAEVLHDVGCANSICFSPDGTVMYFADTAGQDILAYDYEPQSGTPHSPRLFARGPGDLGKPDGSCVDASGALWNARFGGACVQRFLPDGSLDQRIDLPVPNVTCCCIGGRQMSRMFITTARLGMTAQDLAQCPQAGGLFAVDLNQAGLDHGYFHGQRTTA